MKPATTCPTENAAAVSSAVAARNTVESNLPGGHLRWVSDFFILTKARVNALVVATTFVGFALHSGVTSYWWLLLHTLLGTGLVAGAAAAANQTMEWRFDQMMARTRKRPIAAGRFSSRSGALVSALLLVAGSLWLGLAVNFRAMLIAVVTYLIYVFAYTPLKRRSSVCVLAGAVAGALPLLIGWAATDAPFGWWTAAAFGVLFFWQMPHFWAIAWWCRADYTRAGYHVLPLDDVRGHWTAGLALFYAIVTVAVSLLPAWRLSASIFYWAGGVALGLGFLFFTGWFLVRRSLTTARWLFIASLFYLPLIYALMLLAR